VPARCSSRSPEQITKESDDGQTWRLLQVTFPDTIATHNREQVFHYDAEGMQRRMDYAPDVSGNPAVAHYTSDPKTFGGIVFPSGRVHRQNPDGTANLTVTTIPIDIHDITVAQTGERT
jgi:hypothetical protein